ncbi:MAG TPA: hypothetical protein VF595_05935 [Tepidisphaeraceae bacterium]|jgi:hypothetical protein
MASTLPNPLRHYFAGPLVPPPSLAELGEFSFEQWFVTTGDAIAKVDRGLAPNLIAYRARLEALTAGRDTQSIQRFKAEVDEALAAIPKYRAALQAIKGQAIHIETSRDIDGDKPLRVRPVNPRKRPPTVAVEP